MNQKKVKLIRIN